MFEKKIIDCIIKKIQFPSFISIKIIIFVINKILTHHSYFSTYDFYYFLILLLSFLDMAFTFLILLSSFLYSFIL